jgi:deoxyribose-phosphate aldolase
MNKVDELAKMIDHSILHPAFTDEDLKRECEVAVKYNVASVCVKPYAVKQAAEFIKGSDVVNCCVIGFPHGNSSTKVKSFETEQACIDGATEIDMVVNIGKVLGNDWDFVEAEIEAINNVCKKHGALLKVIFENDYYRGRDDLKIKLCKICTRVGVAWVKTSTGYGFVKGPDGKYSYEGATEHDLKLMRRHSGPDVQIKAAGGIRTLDDLLKVQKLGCTRCGATATIAMLEEAKKRFNS